MYLRNKCEIIQRKTLRKLHYYTNGTNICKNHVSHMHKDWSLGNTGLNYLFISKSKSSWFFVFVTVFLHHLLCLVWFPLHALIDLCEAGFGPQVYIQLEPPWMLHIMILSHLSSVTSILAQVPDAYLFLPPSGFNIRKCRNREWIFIATFCFWGRLSTWTHFLPRMVHGEMFYWEITYMKLGVGS